MPFFRELGLAGQSGEYFVFGSPFKPGEGNRGNLNGIRGAARSDYFIPSPTPVKRDTITKMWNRVVINGLKIKKHLYAAKHTGANEKIMAGVSLDALQTLYGHSSKLMTTKYVTEIQEIHAKALIENSPDFV